MDSGTPERTSAPVAAAAAAEKPETAVEHAEVLDGKYHTLGRKTMLIFVLRRIHTSMVILLLTMAAFALQGQPFMKQLFGGRMAPYANMVTWWMLILFLVVFGLTYFISWLTYINYKFLIGEDSLKIKRGILSREEIAIPYRQIQDADIERSLYYRMMGLSRLVILTAGREEGRDKDESEGVLPAMDRDLAEWMQEELLKRTEVQRVEEVSPAEAGQIADEGSAENGG